MLPHASTNREGGRNKEKEEEAEEEEEETRARKRDSACFGSMCCRQDLASIIMSYSFEPSPQTCLEARLAGIWPQVSSEIVLALLETMTDAAALPEGTGTCTQFNVMKASPVGMVCPIRFTRRDCVLGVHVQMRFCQGFGFIDMGGVTVFVHSSDCEPGKQPKEGDVLTFNYEPRTVHALSFHFCAR